MASKIVVESSKIKIIKNVGSPTDKKNRAIIRVSEDIYDRLEDIHSQTGVPITKLASSAISFALDKIVIIEHEDDSDVSEFDRE